MHRVRRASTQPVCSAPCVADATVTAIGRALPGGTSQKHALMSRPVIPTRHLHGQRVKHYPWPVSATHWGAHPPGVVGGLVGPGRANAIIQLAGVTGGERSLCHRPYEEVHTLASEDKRRTHQAFLRGLQAVLPVGCRPIIVRCGLSHALVSAGRGVGLGLGRADPQPAQDALVQWWTLLTPTAVINGRCMALIPGSGSTDRSNPLVCQFEQVYRGKAFMQAQALYLLR